MDNTMPSSTRPTSELPAGITEEFVQALREHGVVSAALFGSVARGDDRPDSDIDLLVVFERPVPLFAQLRLAQQLERIAGRRVDLMTEIHPAFQPYILPTLVALPL